MRDLYNEVTNTIIAKLEAGTVPWRRGWNAGTGIPMNAVTNRPYSGVNVLLFWLSEGKGYKSPRFLTYKQAQEVGGQVRKGEHGTTVIFYKQLTVKDKKNPDEDKRIPLLRGYTVFNVDQVDNLPDHVKFGPAYTGEVNPDDRDASADQFITSTGADFREGKGKPSYIPSKDFITVPAWEDFHSKPEFYTTTFHELVHWTGAKSRLDRDLKGRFGNEQYAAEELIAELGSAFLAAEFGYDNSTTDNHAAYIENWLKVLKSDKRAIFTAASKSQKAVDYLRTLALGDTPKVLAEAA